jgi:FMN phosphatase YigB (HAD superfamily)
LLFDLDDTLLDTNMDVFIPAYFQALSSHFADHVPSTAMLSALMTSTNLIYKSQNPMRTLRDVFDGNFYQQLGVSRDEMAGLVESFYDEVFPTLSVHTRQKADAVPLIEWALSSGYRVAIATDPLFPCKATLHRVRWAGLEPECFELISTVENFHFSKTYPAYYAEVLGRMGWRDGPILMVGNDVNRDMIPAQRLGLKTYLIDGESASGSGLEAGRGKLADLRPWLESIDLSTLEPSFKSRDAILGIMASTPAVLRSLSSSLTDEQWKHEPTREDWALTEIVCHLRDTEREVHQTQLKLTLERTDAFIPRPDSGVWANEREYLNVNGSMALTEFVSARMETLDMLKDLDDATWSRNARHAIFGPTNFLEVLGFMAEHDRLHIQQAWKTLQSV